MTVHWDRPGVFEVSSIVVEHAFADDGSLSPAIVGAMRVSFFDADGEIVDIMVYAAENGGRNAIEVFVTSEALSGIKRVPLAIPTAEFPVVKLPAAENDNEIPI